MSAATGHPEPAGSRPDAGPSGPGAAQAPRRLARPLGDLWSSDETGRRFDVLIVGSGYGGSIAASRLAGATLDEAAGEAAGQDRHHGPLRIGLLERGREYLPGEFPSRFADLPGHLRTGDQSSGRVGGDREGLFDLRLGPDVAALVGNGLGGGSLINAGVMLEADPDDHPADSVARELLQSLHAGGHYGRAMTMLGGRLPAVQGGQYNTIALHAFRPDGGRGAAGPLRKTAALHGLSPRGAFGLAPITVAMTDRANDAGVTLEHHSPDVRHAGAVFEQDTHVRVALDVGDFAGSISHTHDDVAAEAKVSQGNGVRESIRIDGAQYRPRRTAIEIRLNFFIAELSRHEREANRHAGVAIAQMCSAAPSAIPRRENTAPPCRAG